MANNRKSSVWFILLIIPIVHAVGYFFYNRIFQKELSALDAIPSSSMFFIEINNPPEFAGKKLMNKAFWKSLQGIPAIQQIDKELVLIASLFKISHSPVANNNKLIISFHPLNDSLPALFILETDKPGINIAEQLSKIQKSDISFISDEENPETTVKQYSFGNKGKRFFTTSENGLFLLSPSKKLLSAAIDQLNSGSHFSENKLFKRISETAGKNVDAHIYIRSSQTGDLSAIAGKNIATNAKFLLNNFADWTELDLILKNNELLLNGYTAADDSMNRYLNIFRHTEAPEIRMPSILPYNTRLLLHTGVEDFEKYYLAFEEYLRKTGEYDQYYQKVAGFNNRYDLNIEEQFLSWIGNEMAMASIAEEERDFKDGSYVVIKAKDPVKAAQSLAEVMRNVPGSSLIKTYRDYPINKINLPGIYQVLFGDIFSFLENPCYTIINDYVIFANESKALEEFIRSYASGKTLNANNNYKEFSDNISDRSNIYLYFNTRNSLDVLSYFVNEELAGILNEYRDVLNNFEGFALQLSALNDIYYTNAYLRYNPDYVEENRAAWKTELDAPMIGKPFLVKDHTDKTFNVIVFDEENKLYLIDNNGNILWKTAYAGKLLSEVYPVDYYKNRKIQYLFNTSEYMYLIDLLGRNVANYPIKLNAAPTNGIAVFDYINNKEYRIIFAGSNNKVYNYQLNGNTVRGWKEPRVDAEVTQPVQHLVYGNKDYIIIPEDDGSVYIADRRGQRRIRIRNEFKNAVKTPFYINNTNSKGIMITTDVKGHLVYIKADGNIEETVFDEFSPGHYFVYDDLDKNGAEDFIFLDKNKLVVFDRFKEVMFEHTFNEEINVKPEVIPVSYRQNVLAVVSDTENKIMLFDDKGQNIYNGELAGSTGFAIGSLNNNKELNLLIGSGNTLYNYLLK